MSRDSFSTGQFIPDTTIFEIPPAQIDFHFFATSSNKIMVRYHEIGRSAKLVKSYPKAKTGIIEKKQAALKHVHKKVPVVTPHQDTISGITKETTSPDVISEYSKVPPTHHRIENVRVVPDQVNWLTGILFFSFFLMAFARFAHNKFFSRVTDSIFNYHAAFNLFNERNTLVLRGAVLMNMVFFINAAVFLFELMQNHGINMLGYSGIHLFLLCLAGLGGIYSGKILSFQIVGQIFNGSLEVRKYLHTVFIYNKNLGLFLFPVVISVPFVAPHAGSLLLKAGMVLALFFYLLRILRGIRILLQKHVSIFYMILYLCALEILPLLIIYKLLISFIIRH